MISALRLLIPFIQAESPVVRKEKNMSKIHSFQDRLARRTSDEPEPSLPQSQAVRAIQILRIPTIQKFGVTDSLPAGHCLPVSKPWGQRTVHPESALGIIGNISVWRQLVITSDGLFVATGFDWGDNRGAQYKDLKRAGIVAAYRAAESTSAEQIMSVSDERFGPMKPLFFDCGWG